MRFASAAGLVGLATLAACGSSPPRASRVAPGGLPGANVMELSVNGATCGGGGGAYQNEPCVRVTICQPGTSTCATVDDVLLDTGSYGLRLFKETLPFTLPLAASGSATLAECIQFLDGASDWGPVATADVVLGGEPAIRIPIHLIDATFGPPPAGCPGPDPSAVAAGFNGILGVGLFAEDCGTACATSARVGLYYACAGGSCAQTTVPVASQVPNPVARLPVDNNGVMVDLPAVSSGGAASVAGSLVLGIDTQANNASTGVTAYPADPRTGELRTTFGGATGVGFLDTGSNGFFFAPPSSGTLPTCASPNTSWYCPARPVGLSATNAGASGAPSGLVSFSVANAVTLFASGQAVLGDLGGPSPAGSGFDFGLPFFLGQPVFVGLAGTSSSGLGSGPYFAY